MIATDAPPRAFGRYSVLAVLGRGAMGVVYKAHDPALDREVAIKVVITELLDADDRADYLERFRREARAAARCAHRNIVAVYDFAEAEGNPFIVMELVDGIELGRLIRDCGKLPVDDAVELTTQMLAALGHAHALGIVHRDIKPANVLVLPDTQVKIADFGVARLGNVSRTQIGTVVGTPKYMAPEQALGKPVDHRADLFAAAAIFHQMLSGKPPFTGDTPDEIVARVIHGEPGSLDEAETQRFPMLPSFFERALAKDPEQRFPTADAFAAALRQAIGGADDAGDSTRIVPRAVVAAAAALDARTVDEAEKALASHIGPIAKVLVRKAAGTATTQMQLYEAVAGNISDETARSAFLRRAAAANGEASQSGTTSAASFGATRAAALAPEVLEAAQEALTFFVGPIARVLVRKAAERAPSEAAFYEFLETHLPREEDKTAFRRRLRKDADRRVTQ
jgi:serine/threonine-protein kinase